MKKIGISIVVLLLGSLMALPARAALIHMEAIIDGTQANAGAGTRSHGMGSASMTLDDATNSFAWDISWFGLGEDVTAAHFHAPALPNQSADVQVNFGAISGLASRSIGSASITDAQARDLLAETWYINIHTTLFPAGEIRGQVIQRIPEPPAAQLIQRNSLAIARGNVGAGVNEKVEAVLVNDCDTAVEIKLHTTAISGGVPRGGIAIEKIELARESVKFVPITLPDSPNTEDGRRYVNLEFWGQPGHCTVLGKGLVRVAIAVVNYADGTVYRSAGLRSDGDLVQATSSAAESKLFVGGLSWDTNDNALVRIGVGQSAHLVLKNHCDIPLKYLVVARTPGSEEQPNIPNGVIEAGSGAVIPLADGNHDNWIDVTSIVWGSHKPGGGAARGHCQQTGISASIEVFDDSDGATRHAEPVRSRRFEFITFEDDPDPSE